MDGQCLKVRADERMKDMRNEEVREGPGVGCQKKKLEKCPLSSFYKRADDKRRQSERGENRKNCKTPAPL